MRSLRSNKGRRTRSYSNNIRNKEYRLNRSQDNNNDGDNFFKFNNSRKKEKAWNDDTKSNRNDDTKSNRSRKSNRSNRSNSRFDLHLRRNSKKDDELRSDYSLKRAVRKETRLRMYEQKPVSIG